MKLKGYNKYTFVKNPTKRDIEQIALWRITLEQIENRQYNPTFRRKLFKEYNLCTYWLGMQKLTD